MKKTYFPHIDGLRAVAVLVVIFFHLGTDYFDGGYVGVDVFFVISGFLITRLILASLDSDRGFSIKNFYIRRFKRLAPALMVTLFFTFIAASLIFTPSDLKRTSGAILSAIFSTSNFYFWLESDYFDVSTKLKPILHTWSLSIEEQFYLFWPFLLILASYRKVKKIRVLLIFTILIISFSLNHLFRDGSIVARFANIPEFLNEPILNFKSSLFFLIPFRIFEFAIGALITGFFNKKLKKTWHYDILFFAGLASIIFSTVTFDDTLLFPYWRALIPCLGAALIIFSGAQTKFAGVLSNRYFVFIGVLSYSLYLTHWPIIVFHSYLVGELDWLSGTSAAVLTFATALALHFWVEKPLRNRDFSRSPIRFKIIGVGFLTLVTISLHSFLNAGWAWRINSPEIKNVALTALSDYHRDYYGGRGYRAYLKKEEVPPPEVILIGDSHGKHYAEGLVKVIGSKYDIKTAIAAGFSCFHLPNFTRKTKEVNYNILCPQKLERALEYMSIHPSNPPIFVVSHSWISQMHRGALLIDGKIAKRTIDLQDVVNGILELKTRIGNSPLIVIGHVPGASINLSQYYSLPPLARWFSGKEDYRFVPSNKKIVEFNSHLENFLQNKSGIHFIDPHDVFCRKKICQNFDGNGNFIYSDTSHLSKFGSIYFFEEIEDQFIKLAVDRNFTAK